MEWSGGVCRSVLFVVVVVVVFCCLSMILGRNLLGEGRDTHQGLDVTSGEK